MSEFTKLVGPGESEDVTIDWSDTLAAGETISASVWSSSDVTPGIDSKTDDTTTTRFSGATEWTYGELLNRVTTSVGRILEREIVIKCRPIRE